MTQPQSSVLPETVSGVHLNSGYEVLHSFGAGTDGANSWASLIDADGTLYGTTLNGGEFTLGTVFSTTPSGTEKVLHSFRYDGSDGASPQASLIAVDGTLYGTTAGGGTNNLYGTVFSITRSGAEKVLHSFGSGKDGRGPAASLIAVGGTFYGTTLDGGKYRQGTVFSITRTGTEKVLHSFGSGSDGVNPATSLTDVDGTLYGTTAQGGKDGGGTVYSMTLSGAEKVLLNFANTGPKGADPRASLIDVNGVLYGTTYLGGTYGDGTVFSVTRSGKEHVLHSFGSGTDGKRPAASMIVVKGTLYGTTSKGGSYSDSGTVFSVTTSGVEKVLHSFTGPDGANPIANLIGVNGTLYGTTLDGGTNRVGTVFRITP